MSQQPGDKRDCHVCSKPATWQCPEDAGPAGWHGAWLCDTCRCSCGGNPRVAPSHVEAPALGIAAEPAAWQVVDKNGKPVEWLAARRRDPATYTNPEGDLNIADNAEVDGFPHRWEQLYRLPQGVEAVARSSKAATPDTRETVGASSPTPEHVTGTTCPPDERAANRALLAKKIADDGLAAVVEDMGDDEYKEFKLFVIGALRGRLDNQAARSATEAPVASAWNAALEAAAAEVEGHWNHCDTEVNQQAQARRSAAAIRKLKRASTDGRSP